MQMFTCMCTIYHLVFNIVALNSGIHPHVCVSASWNYLPDTMASILYNQRRWPSTSNSKASVLSTLSAVCI